MTTALQRPPTVTLATPPEDVRDVWHQLQWIKAQLRKWDAELREQILDYLRENGDVDLGTGQRLYAGPDRKWEQLVGHEDVVWSLTGMPDMPDPEAGMERLAAALAASPWKVATVREVVGEDAFAQMFRKVDKGKVAEGSAKNLTIKTTRREGP